VGVVEDGCICIGKGLWIVVGSWSVIIIIIKSYVWSGAFLSFMALSRHHKTSTEEIEKREKMMRRIDTHTHKSCWGQGKLSETQ